jgi:putative nucleotidyltransferase with HDIG domain
VKRVIERVSYEKSISAQCLRIANSPLYARGRATESIQGAVFSLGIRKIEDILLSTCLSRLVPREKWATDPGAFWGHSLGCALVCKEFAERVSYSDPEKAYLAGLLHDLGIIVNSIAYTKEYRAVIEAAAKSGEALDRQERQNLGFTHGESGSILARSWKLPAAIVDVIEWHHDLEQAPKREALIALVHLGDLLCRMRGLGYGYEEWRGVELAAEPGWAELAEECPRLSSMDLVRFTLDLDTHVARVTEMVEAVFGGELKCPRDHI